MAKTDELTIVEDQWITQILIVPGTAVTTEVVTGTEIMIEEVAETAEVREAGVRTGGVAKTETSIESETDEALHQVGREGSDWSGAPRRITGRSATG